jgi:hypothetical protein
LKGYRFNTFDATVCTPESNIITDSNKFYFAELGIVHTCALNTKLCTECDVNPITCKNCVAGRILPEKGCLCDIGFYSDTN